MKTSFKMEKEEIMAVYLLFLRYYPITLLNAIRGICVAEPIKGDLQAWLEYTNVLPQQEKASNHICFEKQLAHVRMMGM